jgi:hypothetical protein
MLISYTALEVLLSLLRMAKVEHRKETILRDPNIESFEICRVQVFSRQLAITTEAAGLAI